MRTVRVERTIEAPPERVFDLLTDHAGYERFRGITGSALLREGKPAPNGLGALRKIDVGLLHFTEEVTVFEPASRMDYLIVKVNMPFEHEGGRIELERDGDGTHVVWTSTFRVPVSALGGAMERAFGLVLGRGFASVLRDTERLVDRG